MVMRHDGVNSALRVVIYEERVQPIGGNQRYIDLLARNFDPTEIDLLVVTPYHGSLNELLPEDRSIFLKRRREALGLVRRVLALDRVLRRLAPDLLLCHNSRSLSIGAIPAALRGIPVIWHVKTSSTTKVRDLLACFPVRRVLTISDEVLAKKNPWVRRFCYRSAQCIPIGIDLKDFMGIPAPDPDPGSLRALVISRIHPAKGLDTLVEAFEHLGERADGIRVTICGGIPPGRESYADTLRNSISRVAAAAIELAGWQDSVVPFLDSCDVAVLPSMAEGVPRSLVEAMAAARPVLATSVGGIPELVEDGVTGRLVAPGDAEALAGALVWFREHPEEARRMGQRARKHVREKHDIRSHIRHLATHLHEVARQ